jgi:hypothetical protein
MGIEAHQRQQKASAAFTKQKNIPGRRHFAEKSGAAPLKQAAGGDAFQPAIMRRYGVKTHADRNRWRRAARFHQAQATRPPIQ